ncbi:MAG: precorrin-2 C(20)-methyltransferase [Treponema sp.]|nr:precorrin-2 C(20)-methyltransferase [Treponema sp.]
MKNGIFYAVSVGPGGSELMTLQAARVLNDCPVICFPETNSSSGSKHHIAYDAVAGAVSLSEKIKHFFSIPMTRDRQKIFAAYEQVVSVCAEHMRGGKDVAFVTIGDVSLYSTAAKIAEMVREQGFCVKFVAGVNAFSAAASASLVSLTDRDEPVSIIPADAFYIEEKLESALRADGTKILMKLGRHLSEIIALVDECGLLERATLVQKVSLPDERIVRGAALRVLDDDVWADSYLSVIIVQGKAE